MKKSESNSLRIAQKLRVGLPPKRQAAKIWSKTLPRKSKQSRRQLPLQRRISPNLRGNRMKQTATSSYLTRRKVLIQRKRQPSGPRSKTYFRILSKESTTKRDVASLPSSLAV